MKVSRVKCVPAWQVTLVVVCFNGFERLSSSVMSKVLVPRTHSRPATSGEPAADGSVARKLLHDARHGKGPGDPQRSKQLQQAVYCAMP